MQRRVCMLVRSAWSCMKDKSFWYGVLAVSPGVSFFREALMVDGYVLAIVIFFAGFYVEEWIQSHDYKWLARGWHLIIFSVFSIDEVTQHEYVQYGLEWWHHVWMSLV